MLRPNTDAHTPIARARSRASVMTLTTIANATGLSIDAPIPWSTRAPIRTAAVGASAHATDPMAKTTRPQRNTLRRPSRSASAPALISALASTSV